MTTPSSVMLGPVRPSLSFALCFLSACGGTPSADAGTDAAREAAILCASDLECDDGNFCNGREICNHTVGADARGCLPPAAHACRAAQTCDEASRTCTTDCSAGGDADGDGHRATSCGGDDCDDTDPAVHAGATEVCDSAGADEDCDPATLGGPTDSDADHDGFLRNACCDTQPDGSLLCGTDCDDSNAAVHPGAPEVCNGLDDDCNSHIDDGATRTLHVDADHDGFGDPAVTMSGPCGAASGLVVDATDCDDTSAAVHPGAPEVCDGLDQSCNGVIDEGCPDGSVSITAGATGPMPVGTGAIFFHDVCPTGDVLVGLALGTDAGGAVVRAGGLCAPLTVAIDSSATPYARRFATGIVAALPEHGTAATTAPEACAAGELVSRIGTGLVLTCATYDLPGAAGHVVTLRTADAESVGPGTGEPMGTPFRCPDDSVGIGLAGYEVSGTFAFTGMTCGSVTPGMVPSP